MQTLDDRGRLTIRKEFRERLGNRFVQILTPHGILLRPVPDKLPPNENLPAALEATGETEALSQAGR